MVLHGTGALSFSGIRSEFGGGTGPVSMGDLYGTAGGVAETGSIAFGQFLGKAGSTGATVESFPPSSMTAEATPTPDGDYAATNRHTANLDPSSYGGWRAFDGSTDTFAYNYADHYSRVTGDVLLDNWVLLHVPKAVRVTSYTVYTTPELGCPVSWVLEGSADNSTFYQIDARSDIAITVASNQTFTPTMTGSALRYSRYLRFRPTRLYTDGLSGTLSYIIRSLSYSGFSQAPAGLRVFVDPRDTRFASNAGGAVLTDVLGRASGSLIGTPTFISPYIEFNGTSQFATIANVPGVTDFDHTASYSVAFWLWPAATQPGSDASCVVEKWSTNGTSYPFVFRYIAPGHVFMAAFDGSLFPSVRSANGSVPAQAWAHVVGTYNHSAKRMTLYINGVLAGQNSAYTLNGASNSSDVHLGRRGGSMDNASIRFRGRLGDIRIFDKELGALEVSTMFSERIQMYTQLDKSVPPSRGLAYRVVSGYFSDTPAYLATGAVTASGFTLNTSSITHGTAGAVRVNGGDHYTVEWIGLFRAHTSGTYAFHANSDDASYLWVGDAAYNNFTAANAVVSNGGIHSMRSVSGTVTLTAGRYYHLRAQFGEYTGEDNCSISFTPPGGAQTYTGSGYYYEFPWLRPKPSSGLAFKAVFGSSTLPTASDYGGYALTASPTPPTMVNDPQRGYVLSCGNAASYLTTNFSLPASYTKMAWVFFTVLQDSYYMNIISSGSVAKNNHYLYGDAKKISAGHSTSGQVINYVSDTSPPPLNTWVHFAVTYDNASTTMKLYRNGAVVSTATNAALSWSGGNACAIGTHFGQAIMRGCIDDAYIYDRALPEEEVREMYAAPFTQYPPAPLTGDTTSVTGQPYGNGDYVVSASSAVLPDEAPYLAFDKALTDRMWTCAPDNYTTGTGAYIGGSSTVIDGASYAGEWLQIKLPVALVLKHYKLYTRHNDLTRGPRDFTIAGSFDGSRWYSVHTVAGVIGWTTDGAVFAVPNEAPAFQYFRIAVNTTDGNGWLTINEWVLFGDELPVASLPAPKLCLFMSSPSVAALQNGASIRSWCGATAYATGAAGLPTLVRTDGDPFVRFGTGAASTTNGNYLDFGPQTFDMATNAGMTFVGMVRMRGPSASTWERVFDFGKGTNNDNVILGRWGASTNYGVSYRNGIAAYDSSAGTIDGEWHVVSVRYLPGEIALFVDGTKHTVMNAPTLTDKAFTATYVAKSWFADSYANLDMRDARWFDRGLTDAEVHTVIDDIRQ